MSKTKTASKVEVKSKNTVLVSQSVKRRAKATLFCKRRKQSKSSASMCDIVTFMKIILLCCPSVMIVMPEESKESVEQFVVGSLLMIISTILWLYIVYKVYKMCQPRR